MTDAIPDPTRREGSTEDDEEPVVGPFTDFGQFGPGNIDTRVVYQDIYWVDINGHPHFITDMSTTYLINVLNFLHRQAPTWWLKEFVWVAANIALDPEHQPLAEHMAQRLQDLGPEAWMEDTRLVRGLRSELARRGDVALG